MSNRAVFLDRDGTIARDVHYCRHPEDFKLFKDVPFSIKMLNENGYKTVLVTTNGTAFPACPDHKASNLAEAVKWILG
jgi:histidinol phosphatase-like enzyme